MTLRIDESADGTQRLIYDDMNPHIYQEEARCTVCGEWFPVEDVLWSLPDGTLNTDIGDAYCEADCPEQPDYDDPK